MLPLGFSYGMLPLVIFLFLAKKYWVCKYNPYNPHNLYNTPIDVGERNEQL